VDEREREIVEGWAHVAEDLNAGKIQIRPLTPKELAQVERAALIERTAGAMLPNILIKQAGG